VTIVVKRGLVRAGRIVVDEVSYRARRDGMGSYIVPEARTQAPGHVRYLFWRDHLYLENPSHRVEILFHTGETSFEFDDRTYQIGPMTEGHVIIRERNRTVVEGSVTPSGVRLETIAVELEPIQNELAFGLALRSEDLFRQLNYGGTG